MTMVSAPAGEFIGVADGPVTRFLGIPYALAPQGDLRFRAPVSRPRLAEPFRALAAGATPQVGTPSPFTTIPEPSVAGDDILTLSVVAPTSSLGSGGLLPVMVWIHGGGFVTGSPASPWYDGASFARDGVLTVVISYRLGIEGFAHFDDGDQDANLAMQDWLCALRWVSANIASFGGDPDRVIIAGQSAGGAAVLALLACPAAEGSFGGAVSISGIDASNGPEVALRTTQRLAAALGIPPTREAFATVDRMRLQELAAGWAAAHPEDGALPFAPVHGTALLPAPVSEALGVAGAAVPLLLGSTLDEFDSPGWPELARAAGVDAPPVSALPDGTRITDVLFRATCARVAATRAAAAPTWLYSFDWVSPRLRGAGHCIDLPFFFDLLGTDGVEAVFGPNPPQELARQMHRDLVEFVQGGPLPWAVARGREDDVARRYGVDGSHADASGVYAQHLSEYPS